MYCKMDVDDAFVAAGAERRMGCRCAASPVAPSTDRGCICSKCGARCKECIGFGFAAPPPRRFHRIMSRIRSQIRRRTSLSGSPPGFVRIHLDEINVLLSKVEGEDAGHWAAQFVDPGPPMRVFDVIIIRDRRRG